MEDSSSIAVVVKAGKLNGQGYRRTVIIQFNNMVLISRIK